MFDIKPDFLQRVAEGDYSYYTHLIKFAENRDIDLGETKDIWNFPDEGDYTYSTTADIDSISSDSASDTQEVRVFGLDENWEEVEQVVTLNGQTRVALGTPLIRCFRAYNDNGTDLVGNVYIYVNTALSTGKPIDTTKVRAYIAIGENQTLMIQYTIPAGKTGYILNYTASISSHVASSAVIKIVVRAFGKIFRTQSKFALTSTGVGRSTLDLPIPFVLPEKTDINATASSNTNNISVSGSYTVLLKDN